jgi:uncharacterized membrane protein YjfL (UPF0719 family)
MVAVTRADHPIFIINNIMENYIQIKAIIASVTFSIIGTVLLLLMFWIVEKLTPENLWKEILVNQNKALAIVIGAFVLAIGIIIASAIH